MDFTANAGSRGHEFPSVINGIIEGALGKCRCGLCINPTKNRAESLYHQGKDSRVPPPAARLCPSYILDDISWKDSQVDLKRNFLVPFATRAAWKIGEIL